MTMTLPTPSDTPIKLVYSNISFSDEPQLAQQIKAIYPDIIIPYTDFTNITASDRASLDSYLFLKTADPYLFIRNLEHSIKKLSLTYLGDCKDYHLLEFYKMTQSQVSQTIHLNTLYRVTGGEFKNLIVTPVSITQDMSQVTLRYSVMNDQHTLTLPPSSIEPLSPQDPSYHAYAESDSYFRNVTRMNSAIIIDGHNILYRSIYGYPTKYATATKTFIGGGYGFYFVLLKLKMMFPEYPMYVCFDSSIRNKLSYYPEYKGSRPERSQKFRDAFESNLQWVTRLCKALGFPVFRIDDQEGDDVIGSVAHNLIKLGFKDVIIYSQDGDFKQCLTSDPEHTIRILQPKSSFKQNTHFVTAGDVMSEYGVNRVDKTVWVKAFKGDVSDNIISINKFYKENEQTVSRVSGRDYLTMVNENDTIDSLRNELLTSKKFEPFVSSGQFDKNLQILTINQNLFETYPFQLYSPSNFSQDEFAKVLLEYSMYREVEFLEKYSRIFQGLC